jgi:transposase-like protein
LTGEDRAVAVRWQLRFRLSFREIKELLAQRGIEVAHVTVNRSVGTFYARVHRRRLTRRLGW